MALVSITRPCGADLHVDDDDDDEYGLSSFDDASTRRTEQTAEDALGTPFLPFDFLCSWYTPIPEDHTWHYAKRGHETQKHLIPKSLLTQAQNNNKDQCSVGSPVSSPSGLKSLTYFEDNMPPVSSRRHSGSTPRRSDTLSSCSTEDEHDVEGLLYALEMMQRKQKKLEMQLESAGIPVAEDIPYWKAKSKVEHIGRRMNELGKDQGEEYFKLQREYEKYNAALKLTEEWIQEQAEKEREWEKDNQFENKLALKRVRRYMPVNIRSLTEAKLCLEKTPNGKVFLPAVARKFKSTDVLQLIRVDPVEIERMHPSQLLTLRLAGLTLTERRALHSHLRPVGDHWKTKQADPMAERKWKWFKKLKQNFMETLDAYHRHVEEYGPPGNHAYATKENPNAGCPLRGTQCPLVADKVINYDVIGYGYTDKALYEVPKIGMTVEEKKKAITAEALARDVEAQRVEELKHHYKGQAGLKVSVANSSCVAMVEAMDRMEEWQDKWIEDRFYHPDTTNDRVHKELSGFSDALSSLQLYLLQVTALSTLEEGSQRKEDDEVPHDEEPMDERSPLEIGLSEDLYFAATDFFKGIGARMIEMKIHDSRIVMLIDDLKKILDRLHQRNMSALTRPGAEAPIRSRDLKLHNDIFAEVRVRVEKEWRAKAELKAKRERERRERKERERERARAETPSRRVSFGRSPNNRRRSVEVPAPLERQDSLSGNTKDFFVSLLGLTPNRTEVDTTSGSQKLSFPNDDSAAKKAEVTRSRSRNGSPDSSGASRSPTSPRERASPIKKSHQTMVYASPSTHRSKGYPKAMSTSPEEHSKLIIPTLGPSEATAQGSASLARATSPQVLVEHRKTSETTAKHLRNRSAKGHHEEEKKECAYENDVVVQVRLPPRRTFEC
mmetsp:Transcript_12709/g.18728  ORF Transcript_12709/g.18728 Transcript_12709/m.18728 type:complete len:893 (-) Transcript_12709:151-2829(-)|eukprot:CAMPEP_0194046800 /NCGR_PEP_ID=MMETSP0009_2-20130614/22315_1 /TAXON_ID=210454 /ORGANISM="Grammatophora oceanica, Strain CCMP 410" /LENGTH=892 /DNA_ID=CAMNT_0038692223 /DNA_START=27 /DNA_END=2705 /DNA_ORIENTATION=-